MFYVLWLCICAALVYLGIRCGLPGVATAIHEGRARRETGRVVGWGAMDDDNWNSAPHYYVYTVQTATHGNCTVRDHVHHSLHEVRFRFATPEEVSYYWAPECRASGLVRYSCLNDAEWAACQANFCLAMVLGYGPLLLSAACCATVLARRLLCAPRPRDTYICNEMPYLEVVVDEHVHV